MNRYLVSIEVEVLAGSTNEAEENVEGLMTHAFETCNDEGRFTAFRLHASSDTLKIG